MCKDLEKLTEQEGVELKQTVDSIAGWRNKVLGGVAVAVVLLALVAGVISWTFTRMMTQAENAIHELSVSNTEMTKSVSKLNTDFLVFQKEVQPFITAGPRFTQTDYDRNIKASLAEFKETLPPDGTRMTLKNLEASDQNIRSAADSNQRRIEALERFVQEHNGGGAPTP